MAGHDYISDDEDDNISQISQISDTSTQRYNSTKTSPVISVLGRRKSPETSQETQPKKYNPNSNPKPNPDPNPNPTPNPNPNPVKIAEGLSEQLVPILSGHKKEKIAKKKQTHTTIKDNQNAVIAETFKVTLLFHKNGYIDPVPEHMETFLHEMKKITSSPVPNTTNNITPLPDHNNWLFVDKNNATNITPDEPAHVPMESNAIDNVPLHEPIHLTSTEPALDTTNNASPHILLETNNDAESEHVTMEADHVNNDDTMRSDTTVPALDTTNNASPHTLLETNNNAKSEHVTMEADHVNNDDTMRSDTTVPAIVETTNNATNSLMSLLPEHINNSSAASRPLQTQKINKVITNILKYSSIPSSSSKHITHSQLTSKQQKTLLSELLQKSSPIRHLLAVDASTNKNQKELSLMLAKERMRLIQKNKKAHPPPDPDNKISLQTEPPATNITQSVQSYQFAMAAFELEQSLNAPTLPTTPNPASTTTSSVIVTPTQAKIQLRHVEVAPPSPLIVARATDLDQTRAKILSEERSRAPASTSAPAPTERVPEFVEVKKKLRSTRKPIPDKMPVSEGASSSQPSTNPAPTLIQMPVSENASSSQPSTNPTPTLTQMPVSEGASSNQSSDLNFTSNASQMPAFAGASTGQITNTNPKTKPKPNKIQKPVSMKLFDKDHARRLASTARDVMRKKKTNKQPPPTNKQPTPTNELPIEMTSAMTSATATPTHVSTDMEEITTLTRKRNKRSEPEIEPEILRKRKTNEIIKKFKTMTEPNNEPI